MTIDHNKIDAELNLIRWELIAKRLLRNAENSDYLDDYDTFVLDEKPLPADEIIPAKLACKTKLNVYGGLDKLKARVCLRGDMQIKDDFISWSPTASTRLLKCFIADAIRNKSKTYQLDFIQAFIQSKATKRMFIGRVMTGSN